MLQAGMFSGLENDLVMHGKRIFLKNNKELADC